MIIPRQCVITQQVTASPINAPRWLPDFKVGGGIWGEQCLLGHDQNLQWRTRNNLLTFRNLIPSGQHGPHYQFSANKYHLRHLPCAKHNRVDYTKTNRPLKFTVKVLTFQGKGQMLRQVITQTVPWAKIKWNNLVKCSWQSSNFSTSRLFI